MRMIFRIAIGDWSDDGHGKCNYYQVQSDKSLSDVRETHFKIKEFTDVDVEKICSEYEESYILEDVEKKLVFLGFDFSKTESYKDKGKLYLSPEDCCKIWVFLLNYVDRELNIKIIDEPEMIQFYGFDEKGRHISNPGYGCFG